jgi:hypothetical protein
MYTYGDREAPLPAEALRNESAHQRSHVRAVCQEESVDAHVDTTFMHEIHVTDSRCADGHGASCTKAVEDACNQNGVPLVCVARNDIR